MTHNDQYYQEKKQKLIAKNQRVMQDHISNSLKFADEIREINLELQEIEQILQETKTKK